MQSETVVTRNVPELKKGAKSFDPIKPLPQERCELTLLMPCLNEAESLATCIRKAKNALSKLSVQGEILIADNGSIDGSQDIGIENGARVINVKELGYGAALSEGIKAAKGNFIIMGDADDSYDWSNIEPIYKELQHGNDFVIGCRFPSGGGKVLPNAMPWLHKWIGNPILSMLGRLFFKTDIRDFHCGLRGFSKNAISKLDLKTKGM